jgi:RimJ/RimL family protein N-acetyltransferase
MNDIRVRDAVEADAAALVALRRRLYEQTSYMLWEPAEFTATEADEVERIRRMGAARNCMLMVAEEGGALVGLISATGADRNRIRHCSILALGVDREHWSKGVATRMVEAAIAWAPGAGVTRLELSVHTSNLRALQVYLRCGFAIEGRRRAAYLVDGEYADDYVMARVR